MAVVSDLRHITNASLPYLLSVPKGNKPIHGFPVLCFLHGYDESEPHAIKKALTKHGPLNPNNPARVKEEFIIIAPQMPQAGDLWHRFPDAVQSIVTKVQTDESGDKNKTYLTGIGIYKNTL